MLVICFTGYCLFSKFIHLFKGCFKLAFFFLIKHGIANGGPHPPPLERNPYSTVFHVVEGFALVILCSSRPTTRRLAVSVLREIRALFALLEVPKVRFSHLVSVFETVLLPVRAPCEWGSCSMHST